MVAKITLPGCQPQMHCAVENEEKEESANLSANYH